MALDKYEKGKEQKKDNDREKRREGYYFRQGCQGIMLVSDILTET